MEFLRDPGEDPFLLYVGYMHPHFPLVAPPEFRGLYDPADVELPVVADDQDHGIWQKQCFYEPAVRIPLLLRHPSLQPGRSAAHVSLIDVLPTLRDVAGLTPDATLPGQTLLEAQDRPVLSESHAQGMVDGGFMVKSGPWKYCYYGSGHAPQVFNVDDDPLELHDLSGETPLVRRLDAELRLLLDPDAADARAKSDQAARLSRG